MSRLIFVGLITEGATDIRFLESIIKRTLDELAFDCRGQIETELYPFKINKTGLSFVEQVKRASELGFHDYGLSILCVHTDADNALQRILDTKIIPAREAMNIMSASTHCKTIVYIVPVQMIESWMLADKDLFRAEINSDFSDDRLEINLHPETLSDPKQTIENAIRIARADLTKRQRGKGISISDLYQILGQKVELRSLDNLPSFIKFKDELKNALREINCL